jgi:O-antigen ligase
MGGEGNGISVTSVIFAFYLTAFVLNKRFEFSRKAINLGGLAFLIIFFAAISSIINIDGQSEKITDYSIIFCIILFIVSMSHQEKFPDLIKYGLIYFSFGSAVIGLITIFGFGTEYDADGRLTIFGDNANLVGLRMSIAFSVFAFLIMQGGRGVLFKLLLGAASLLVFSVMITTGSRSAFISLSVSLMVLIFSNMKTVKSLFLSSIALTILSSGIYWYLFETENALSDRLVKSYTERDTAGRGDVWQLYANELLDANKLIFGLGFSGFEDTSRRLFNSVLSPHNVLLEVALISGVSGLLVFVILNAKAGVSAVRLYRKNRFILPFMLLSQYFASVITGQTLNNKIMWLILAFSFTALVPTRRISLGSQSDVSSGV